VVSVSSGTALATYNLKTTGLVWKPPYVLHEEQYQESPPFIFMAMRPPLTYGNPWLAYNYFQRRIKVLRSEMEMALRLAP